MLVEPLLLHLFPLTRRGSGVRAPQRPRSLSGREGEGQEKEEKPGTREIRIPAQPPTPRGPGDGAPLGATGALQVDSKHEPYRRFCAD